MGCVLDISGAVTDAILIMDHGTIILKKSESNRGRTSTMSTPNGIVKSVISDA